VADIDEVTGQNPSVQSLDDTKARPIGFWEACRTPGVMLYALVFTCAKASINAMLFWLPSYLKIDVGFQKVLIIPIVFTIKFGRKLLNYSLVWKWASFLEL